MEECSNSRPCTCTYDCPRHGRCCECVAHHRDNHEGVPGCFFSPEAEATYDRSVEALCRERKKKKKRHGYLYEKGRIIIMTIEKILDGKKMTLLLEGRLDTTTAPQLEADLKTDLNGVEELLMDFEKLEYLSSAGLRVLLSAQKTMNKQGKMVICHVNETIRDVFEVTGFSEILTIE